MKVSISGGFKKKGVVSSLQYSGGLSVAFFTSAKCFFLVSILVDPKQISVVSKSEQPPPGKKKKGLLPPPPVMPLGPLRSSCLQDFSFLFFLGGGAVTSCWLLNLPLVSMHVQKYQFACYSNIIGTKIDLAKIDLRVHLS